MKNKLLHVIIILLTGGLLTAVTLSTLTTAPVTQAAPTAVAYPDQRDALAHSVSWLMGQQNGDGGFSSFGGASSASGTLSGIIAIGSGGYNANAVYPRQSKSAVDYLRDNISDTITFAAGNGGSAGKTVLALAAANQNPANFVGYNFVISITAQLSTTGQYAPDPFKHSLAMLGLNAVSETVPVTATQWLIGEQLADGAWDNGYGSATADTDATAMAVMALLATGTPVSATAIVSATAFFSTTQLATGGWGSGFGENANSTGLVVQALSAMGEDFYSDSGNWAKGGVSPLTALLGYQAADGAFQADFGSGLADNLYATTQSIPAVTGKAYPINGRYQAARHAVACLDTIQQSNGGWAQFGTSPANAAGTARAIAAITAFGEDPQSARWTVAPANTKPITALEQLTPAYLTGGRGGRVGIVMQGVVAANSSLTVTDFAGYNLPISVTNFLSPTGAYANTGFGPMAHAEAMLGLQAAGLKADPTAVAFLRDGIQNNSSWSSPDNYGVALQALGHTVSNIVDILHNTQITSSGGWGSWGLSVNSSAEAAQGLAAIGENPFAPEWSVVVNGRVQNTADAIITTQHKSGCWRHSWAPAVDDSSATTDAVMLYMLQPEWRTYTYLPIIVK